jgi:hypothetical protein
MKDNNKYIDNKIRELADFTPNVKPDWDAFYAKNQQAIEGLKTGNGKTTISGFVTSSGVKYTLIAISVVAVFIAGFYFSSDDKTENISTEKSFEQPANNQNNEVIIPAIPLQEKTSKPIPSNDLIKVETGTKVTFDTKNENTEVPAIIIDEKNIPEPVVQDSINADKPVIIKKTIIIQDTIRIKQPDGK